MNEKQEKQKVLTTLLNYGRLPAYRIAGAVGINTHKCLRLLYELEQEGKIIKEEETISTYYRLKGDEYGRDKQR